MKKQIEQTFDSVDFRLHLGISRASSALLSVCTKIQTFQTIQTFQH